MKSEEILRKNFLDWIDTELNRRGWSLRELGRQGDFAISHISNIRRGIRGVTWDTVVSVANAFNENPLDAFIRVGLLDRDVVTKIKNGNGNTSKF